MENLLPCRTTERMWIIYLSHKICSLTKFTYGCCNASCTVILLFGSMTSILESKSRAFSAIKVPMYSIWYKFANHSVGHQLSRETNCRGKWSSMNGLLKINANIPYYAMDKLTNARPILHVLLHCWLQPSCEFLAGSAEHLHNFGPLVNVVSAGE